MGKWLGPAFLVVLLFVYLLAFQAMGIVHLAPVWHEYVHLMSDPAHTAVEFTFVLFDYLIISWVKAQIVKHFHKDIKDGKHND
jgi:hypothetical protein